MGILRQVAKQVLSACVSHRWLLTRGPRSANVHSPRLALTFDDGPHPVHTPVLLDTLRDLGVVGTFFVIGKNAEQYPELIRRMASEGHEIGNHTWSHGEPKQTSTSEFLGEIERTSQLIEELTGQPPVVVRPPKGELNWSKMTGLWKRGDTVALWNVDPRDYRMTSDADAYAWCRSYSSDDGDILLFHDNHPWASIAIQRLSAAENFLLHQCVHVSALANRPKSVVNVSLQNI